MGAFASMAQNSYGLKIMGGVAFVFGLLFLIEFVSLLREKGKKDQYRIVEPVCLFTLSVIFAFRVFYIYFPFIEWLFAAAGVVLVMIFTSKMTHRFRNMKPDNSKLAICILLFHFSIIFFLASLVVVPFAKMISMISGIIAFILILIFIIIGFFKKDWLVNGEIVSPFKMVTHFKDHSIIIVSLMLLFSLYIGFNQVGLIPGIYSDEFPQAYYKMVEDAASKKETPVEGKYKYEAFKEQYDAFLKNKRSRE